MSIILLYTTVLFTSISMLFLSTYLSSKQVMYISIISSFVTVSISYLLIIEMLLFKNTSTIVLRNWIKLDTLNIEFGFYIDAIGSIMLIVISTISIIAQLYSIEYMSNDAHISRFYVYLSFFTFFMLLLVLSENLLQLFIGWEGVGICSYLLVNFWFTRYKANKSSILAVLANKVGDIFLLVLCSVIHYNFKTLSFTLLTYLTVFYTSFIQCDYYYQLHLKIDLFNSISLYNLYFLNVIVNHFNYAEVITFIIILSSIGKSAQFGFHIWLPEAMEGPTPVSSLIHAATMVTAGVFLILRFSFCFSLNSLFFIMFIGAITIFFAASIGFTQVDIKKVIAYSTCSQLGFMFMSCGFQSFIYSFFHLFTHAFFKALLFLTAGYIIHLLNNEQDVRKMGGLLKTLPFAYISLFIGSYSLSGLPFLSGYYSKEPLIENIISTFIKQAESKLSDTFFFFSFLAICTVICTLLYSLKSIFFIFFFEYKNTIYNIFNIHYSNFFLKYALLLLIIFSLYFGFLCSDLFIGINSDFLSNLLFRSYFSIHVLENNPYYRTYFIFILTYCIVGYYYTFINFFSFTTIYVTTYLYYVYTFISKKYLVLNTTFFFLFSYYYYYSLNTLYFVLERGFLEAISTLGIYYLFNAYYVLNLVFITSYTTSIISIIYTFILFFFFFF